MTLSSETNIVKHGGESYSIKLPSKLRHDSQFPFTSDDVLLMSIEKGRLIVMKSNGKI